jgi:HEAT repeat protein
MLPVRPALLSIALVFAATAQDVSKPKDVREIAKGGSASIPRLRPLLKNPSIEIRLEAVKNIVDIGSQHSLDPLIQATADNDPEIQIRATDGLVNFYYPGYVKTGLSASLRRVGNSLKSRFTDTNDQIVDPSIQVRPDVVIAIGKLVRGGSRMDVRANAARAIGVLRGKTAIPDLMDAIRTKDSDVIYESLVALRKIGDEATAPQVGFLIRDFDPRVQIAAIELAGLLHNRQATPLLNDALNRAKDAKVRRAALTSIAMLPDPANRELFSRYLRDKDDRMRGAAAEGFARLKAPSDLPTVEAAYKEETKTSPRLSLAFALVSLGRREVTEFSPLQYLVSNFNSNNWRGEAGPLLTEAAHDQIVRQALYGMLPAGTREEKVGIARVLARSGGADSVAPLEKLQGDNDVEVSSEAGRALRNLRLRL